jgi:hypothetical protein
MAFSLRFSVFHSDLNDFLSPRSVINKMESRSVATEALTPIIARCPCVGSQRSDDVALAQRLVGLLPTRANSAESSRESRPVRGSRNIFTL